MDDQELIRWAAEVMGWVWIPEERRVIGEDENLLQIHSAHWEDKDRQIKYYEGQFNPLTNANHRDMFVERMRELGWYENTRAFADFWECGFCRGMQDIDIMPLAYHEDKSHVVLLAAHKALEGE